MVVRGGHQGRTASCPTAPSRIPACSFPAPGSSELLASALVNVQHKPLGNRDCLLALTLSTIAHREVGITRAQFIVLADVSFVDCAVLSSASPGFGPQVLPDDLTPAPFLGSPSCVDDTYPLCSGKRWGLPASCLFSCSVPRAWTPAGQIGR